MKSLSPFFPRFAERLASGAGDIENIELAKGFAAFLEHLLDRPEFQCDDDE